MSAAGHRWGLLPTPSGSPPSLDLQVQVKSDLVDVRLRSLLARTPQGDALRVHPASPVVFRATQAQLGSDEVLDLFAMGHVPWVELKPELSSDSTHSSATELRLVAADSPSFNEARELGIQLGTLYRHGATLAARTPFYPMTTVLHAHPQLETRMRSFAELVFQLAEVCRTLAPAPLVATQRRAVRIVDARERSRPVKPRLEAHIHWAQHLRIQAMRIVHLLGTRGPSPEEMLAELAGLAASCRIAVGDTVPMPAWLEREPIHLTDFVDRLEHELGPAIHRVRNELGGSSGQ